MADYTGYTTSPDGIYVLDAQGNVVGGANTASYGDSFLTGLNPSAPAPSTDWGSLWNTAWNQGYNNYGNTSNPYSGQSGGGYDVGSAYTQGQQQYLKDKNASAPPPSGGGAPPPATNTNTGDGFSMSYYPGWDETAARADWNATGGAKGQTSGGSSGPSAQELALNALRSSVNRNYDQVYSALDEYAGLIPTQQTAREQSVNNLYNSQQNEINTAMGGSLGALDGARNNVATNQAKSVRDLQENMRNMLQAGNIQLGIGGAGDSSAANMYAYALSKQAGRNSADISNQASSQYGQIDAQAQQIRATADDNLAKLNTWKADNLNSVLTWAQDQVSQIRQQRISATGQKAAALAAAEAGIIQNALTSLQNMDSQIATWKQGIQSWAANRMATLDDAKLKMANSSNYNSADIVAKELKGMNGTTSAATSSANMAGYNPWQKQKDESLSFLNNYRG